MGLPNQHSPRASSSSALSAGVLRVVFLSSVWRDGRERTTRGREMIVRLAKNFMLVELFGLSLVLLEDFCRPVY